MKPKESRRTAERNRDYFFSHRHHYEVLPKEEEQSLCKKIAGLRDKIAEEKSETVLNKLRQDYKTAVDKLIMSNQLLVVRIARQFLGRYLGREHNLFFLDLIQEGNLGLMDAIKKYDHNRNTKFSTYAWNVIKRNIKYAIIEKGYCIRVPDCSFSDNFVQNVDSLEKKVRIKNDGPSKELKDFIADMTVVNPESFVTKQDIIETRENLVSEGLDELDEKRGAMLVQHYFMGQIYDRIGEQEGVRRQAIHQRMLYALKLLKDILLNKAEEEEYMLMAEA